jgi:hypothetical protein
MELSFAGQQVPLTFLGTGGLAINYSIYAGDVSSFAGQSGILQLRGVGYLDNIQFSDQPVPEPSTIGVFGVGALLLSWHLRKSQPS